MKKTTFLIGAACLALGPVAFDTIAYYEDQTLKTHSTEVCKAFNEIEAPSFAVIPKRYKHEDKAKFFELRERCQLSIRNKA